MLEWLAGRCRLALLTGNYEAVARLKLARAGIGRYFPSRQGAFGSDAEDRTSLPAIARRRAGETGRPYPREQTIVIGDTPRDIACAQADMVRCVAVTTGPYRREELGAADAVVSDAAGLKAVLGRAGGALGAGELRAHHQIPHAIGGHPALVDHQVSARRHRVARLRSLGLERLGDRLGHRLGAAAQL